MAIDWDNFLDQVSNTSSFSVTYKLKINKNLMSPSYVFNTALALLPNLFVLHLEQNALSKLEPTGLLSSVTPHLKELYLTNNSIASVAKGALDSAFLTTLHLDSNQLTEIPTHALMVAPNLEELSLSKNLITSLGPKAFLPLSQSLKRLHMDHMGIEKVRQMFLHEKKTRHIRLHHLKIHPCSQIKLYACLQFKLEIRWY